VSYGDSLSIPYEAARHERRVRTGRFLLGAALALIPAGPFVVVSALAANALLDDPTPAAGDFARGLAAWLLAAIPVLTVALSIVSRLSQRGLVGRTYHTLLALFVAGSLALFVGGIVESVFAGDGDQFWAGGFVLGFWVSLFTGGTVLACAAFGSAFD
jgi:hypothetical protein